MDAELVFVQPVDERPCFAVRMIGIVCQNGEYFLWRHVVAAIHPVPIKFAILPIDYECSDLHDLLLHEVSFRRAVRLLATGEIGAGRGTESQSTTSVACSPSRSAQLFAEDLL